MRANSLSAIAMLAVFAPAMAEEPPTPDFPSLHIRQPLEIQAGGMELQSDVADFILGIREQLGLNPLKGTVLDTPNQQAPAFLAELKRIENSVPVSETTPVLPALPASASAPALPPLPEGVVEAAPAIEPLEPDPELVDALRLAAREIDRKANDREMKNDYEAADYLRGVAQQVRSIARRHATVK